MGVYRKGQKIKVEATSIQRSNGAAWDTSSSPTRHCPSLAPRSRNQAAARHTRPSSTATRSGPATTYGGQTSPLADGVLVDPDDPQMPLAGGLDERLLGVEPLAIVGDLRIHAAVVSRDRNRHPLGLAVLLNVVQAFADQRQESDLLRVAERGEVPAQLHLRLDPAARGERVRDVRKRLRQGSGRQERRLHRGRNVPQV